MALRRFSNLQNLFQGCLFRLYRKTNIPVTKKGMTDPAILILGVISPIKKRKSMIELKQANPVRLNILPGVF